MAEGPEDVLLGVAEGSEDVLLGVAEGSECEPRSDKTLVEVILSDETGGQPVGWCALICSISMSTILSIL